MNLVVVGLVVKYLQTGLCVTDLSALQFTFMCRLWQHKKVMEACVQSQMVCRLVLAGDHVFALQLSEWERGFLGIVFYLASCRKCVNMMWNFLYLLITAESISGYVLVIFSADEDVDQIENVKWPNEKGTVVNGNGRGGTSGLSMCFFNVGHSLLRCQV